MSEDSEGTQCKVRVYLVPTHYGDCKVHISYWGFIAKIVIFITSFNLRVRPT